MVLMCKMSQLENWKTTMSTISSMARIKCALVFIVLMIFSIGPIPITSALGLLVVIYRPAWFKELVDTIYADKK